MFHHEPGDIVSPGVTSRWCREMAKRGNDLVAKVLPEAMDEMRRLPVMLSKSGAITQNKGGSNTLGAKSPQDAPGSARQEAGKKGTKKERSYPQASGELPARYGG